MMQDRYAGDIGDYSKFGLLRWLCGARYVDDGPTLRLGLLWYLFDGKDSQAPNDGKYTNYLMAQTGVAATLPKCDQKLYDKLRVLVVSGRRSVAALEKSGVLPPDTLYHSDPLNFDDRLSDTWAEKRRKWLKDGLENVKGTGIVCLDPDNGLEVPSINRLSPKGPKCAFFDDLLPIWKRGQSLVIYQHANRKKGFPVPAQVAQRSEELRNWLSGAEPVALRFRRYSGRVYFVIAQPHHAETLNARIDSFLESNWRSGRTPHFELVQ